MKTYSLIYPENDISSVLLFDEECFVSPNNRACLVLPIKDHLALFFNEHVFKRLVRVSEPVTTVEYMKLVSIIPNILLRDLKGNCTRLGDNPEFKKALREFFLCAICSKIDMLCPVIFIDDLLCSRKHYAYAFLTEGERNEYFPDMGFHITSDDQLHPMISQLDIFEVGGWLFYAYLDQEQTLLERMKYSGDEFDDMIFTYDQLMEMVKDGIKKLRLEPLFEDLMTK